MIYYKSKLIRATFLIGTIGLLAGKCGDGASNEESTLHQDKFAEDAASDTEDKADDIGGKQTKKAEKGSKDPIPVATVVDDSSVVDNSSVIKQPIVEGASIAQKKQLTDAAKQEEEEQKKARQEALKALGNWKEFNPQAKGEQELRTALLTKLNGLLHEKKRNSITKRSLEEIFKDTEGNYEPTGCLGEAIEKVIEFAVPYNWKSPRENVSSKNAIPMRFIVEAILVCHRLQRGDSLSKEEIEEVYTISTYLNKPSYYKRNKSKEAELIREETDKFTYNHNLRPAMDIMKEALKPFLTEEAAEPTA